MKVGTWFSRALVMLLALPLAASVAFAEPPGNQPPDGPPWTPPDERLEQHLRELGLDASQIDKAHTILVAAKRTREESDEKLRKAFDEMRTLLEQDLPDEAAVMRQADRIGAIRTDGRKAMLRALLAVRADLSPEQRKKLNTMMLRDGPPGGPGMFRHGHDSPHKAGPPPEPE